MEKSTEKPTTAHGGTTVAATASKNADAKSVKFRASTVLGADNMDEFENNFVHLAVKAFDANDLESCANLPEDCPLIHAPEWDPEAVAGRTRAVFIFVDMLVPNSASKIELDNFVNWKMHGKDETDGISQLLPPFGDDIESFLLTTGSEAEKVYGAQTYRIILKGAEAHDEADEKANVDYVAAALSGDFQLKINGKTSSASKQSVSSFELPLRIDDAAVGVELNISLSLESLVKTVWTKMKLKEEFLLYLLMLLGGLRLHVDWTDISEVLATLERPTSQKFHFVYWFCQRVVTCVLMQAHNDLLKDKLGRSLVLDIVSCGAKVKVGKHLDKVFHASMEGLGLGLTAARRMKGEDVAGSVKAALAVCDSLEQSGIDVVMEADPNFKFYVEQVIKGKGDEDVDFSITIVDKDGDMVPVPLPDKKNEQLKAAVADELEVDAADILKFKRSNGLVVKKQTHLDDVKRGEVLEVILKGA